ncbi:MAG: hydroxymethylbilane synthase [Acidobacteria bacterium]|nr:hydroxymethylbilane synthase [Acidobacteriota bacterium]
MAGESPSGRTLVIGSRGSPLALRQSGMMRDAIASRNPGLKVEITLIRTTGDRQQEWAAPPSAQTAGKGIFVKEIEEALAAGRIDAAVHSMKDLPTEIPGGLRIAAVPPREDPRDVLAAREPLEFDALPQGARVGTGSPRRVSQLRHRRGDLSYVPLRGNVDTRLRRMREGDVDAVVLAAAGLRRLGLMQPWFTHLPLEICLPAVGQGALAIETRDEEGWVQTAVGTLDDPDTAAAVLAERAFLARLGGGCQVPVAAFATVRGDALSISGVVCDPDGGTMIRVEARGRAADAAGVGAEAAAEAVERGASLILAAVERAAGA